jgi:hypothetical protein
LVAAIVGAIDEGRETDLEKAGLKVTASAQSSAQELVDKLQDAEVSNKVLGTFGPDEEEVLRLIGKVQEEEEEEEEEEAVLDDTRSRADGSAGECCRGGISADLVQELKQEARQAAMERAEAASLSTSISTGTATGTGTGTGAKSERGPAQQMLSNGGVGVAAAFYSGVLGESARGGRGAVDACDDTAEPVTATGSGTGMSSAKEKVQEVLDRAKVTALDAKDDHEPMLPSLAAPANDTSHDSISVVGQSQAVFQHLLKTTMDATMGESAEAGSGGGDGGGGGRVDAQVVKETVAAVQMGDLDSLDMDSILGEALTSITKSIGIDMKEELRGRAGSDEEMQQILGNNMAELVANMRHLDDENAELLAKLGRLQEDLQNSTVEFEEEKGLELEQLLAMQGKFQGEFEKSTAQVQLSATDLVRTVAELEQTGDMLTSLAMFSVKNNSQKAAFVLGLALAFKAPFDALQLFLVRSTEFSDWFTIFTQSVLCVALMNHYGLVRAAFNELSPSRGGCGAKESMEGKE